VTGDVKPCAWICPRHGTLPIGTRWCGRCGEEQEAHAATVEGQLSLDDLPEAS
jgi:hypothetical protein